MTKEIEGKLIGALVYLESGNYQGVKEQIEEVIHLFEIDRQTKEKDMVRQPKKGNRDHGKDKRRRVKKG